MRYPASTRPRWFPGACRCAVISGPSISAFPAASCRRMRTSISTRSHRSYFRVLGVPLLQGRFFDDQDRQGSEPVVIINDAAARKYFPGEDPIGRIVEFEGARRIVGIVGNIRHDGPETDWRDQGFIPLHQSRAVGATLVLRLSRDARDVVPAVKSAIWTYFSDLALPDIEMLSGYLEQARGSATFQHAPADVVRGACGRHRLRRDLWRHGLRGHAADAGDWHSPGARCRAARDPPRESSGGP